MTDLEVFAERLTALEQLLTAPVVAPLSVNPDGTPGHVAAGELIESAWGNAVSDTLTGVIAINTTQNTRLTAIEKQHGAQRMTWARTGVNTTDVNGDLNIPFDGLVFNPIPVVTVCSGQVNPLIYFVVQNPWAQYNSVWVRCFNWGGVPIPNGSVTWNIQVTGTLQ